MSTEEVRPSRATRVFLSSTSRDLKEHREVVRRQCAALGYDLLLMEEFGAQDADAVGVSLKEVEPCKVFVGVYARRYGYVPPGFAASVTEMEYEEAKRLGKPRLIFVAEPGYAGHTLLSEHRDDYDPAVAAKIEEFLRRVGQERVWDTFTTPQHLAGRIVFALSKWEGWRTPSALPSVRRYVGRAELLAETRRSLQDWRRVALLGVGGIGKTLTAQHLAQSLGATFTGGILWVNFGPEANDPEMLLDATMRDWVQHHHPGRLTNPDELNPNLVRNWLAELPGKLLIVFDDIWHAKPAHALLGLIPDNATLLLTTRRADIARQLNVEEQHEINSLSDAEGLAMLRDRVGDIPSRTALRNIVEVLGGHPLALEIVAAQIEQNGPDYAEDLPARLTQNLEGVTELSLLQLEGEARQSSVEAALGLSYDIMSQDLKRRFRALGVVAPEAALRPLILAAVWGVKPDEPEALEDATDRMDALVSSGILSKEPGQALYHMHGLLRAYARALMLTAGEGDEAEDRYAKAIVVISKDGFQRPPEEWRAHDFYLPHIHYLGDQLTKQTASLFGDLDQLAQPEPATPPRTNFSEQERVTLLKELNFTAAVRPYIANRPQTGEAGRRWLQAGLVVARSLNEPLWTSEFLSELGLWHSRRGSPELALSYHEQALRLLETANDPAAETLVLDKMAAVYSHTGRYEEALALYERISALAREQGDQLFEANSLVSMGTIYRQMGQFQQALVLYQQALPVLVEARDMLHAAATLNNIGLVYRLLGQGAQALEYFEQALPLQREGGDSRNEAITLENMAGVHWDMWQVKEAASLYEQALAIKRDIGHVQGEAQVLVNIGTVYQKIGQYAEAMQRYMEALPVLRNVLDAAGEAACLNNIGVIYVLARQHESALPFLEAALALNRKLGNRLGEAKVLNVLGDAYYGLRQAVPAESFYQQALTLSREVGDYPGEAQILQNLGILYHAQGTLDAALEMYRQALEKMRAVGNRNGEAVTLNNMASLLYAMKEPELSLQLLEASLLIMQMLGDERSVVMIYQNIEQLKSEIAASQVNKPTDS